VTGDNAILEKKMRIAFIHPLIKHLGCPIGELSPFASPGKAGGSDSAGALQWWTGQSPEERETLSSLILPLAAPALIINLKIMLEDQKLITSVLLTSALDPAAPWLLLGDRDDELIIRLFPDREAIAFAVIDYLFAGGSPGVSDVRFSASSADFLVFLAAVDLARRMKYTSLLDHAPVADAMTIDDIYISLMDGIKHGDPRWLVPFSLSSFPQVSGQFSIDDLKKSIAALSSINVVTKKENETAVKLAEAGLYISSSLERRYCALSLQAFGSEQDGRPYGKSCLFIRGDRLLWFIDTGGASGQMTGITSVSLETSKKLLDDFFTPLTPPFIKPKEDVPPKGGKCSKCGNALDDGALFCERCGSKAEEEKKKAECHSCRAPLDDGAQFCPKCGAPVKKEPPPSAGVRKCVKCGNSLTPQMKFCSKCGTPAQGDLQPKPVEKICSKCARVLPPEVKFCPKCGTSVQGDLPSKPVEKICSKCARMLPPEVKFCPKCGTPSNS